MTTKEELAGALQRIREGLATKVRILIPADACPVCRHYEGVYEFDEEIPEIPFEGCSCLSGCQAYYAPVLDRRGP